MHLCLRFFIQRRFCPSPCKKLSLGQWSARTGFGFKTHLCSHSARLHAEEHRGNSVLGLQPKLLLWVRTTAPTRDAAAFSRRPRLTYHHVPRPASALTVRGSQESYYELLKSGGFLSEEEAEVLAWGRNARVTVPPRFKASGSHAVSYKRATAMECLVRPWRSHRVYYLGRWCAAAHEDWS